MDIKFGGRDGGRLEFELYADVAPKTVENFRSLCTGEHCKRDEKTEHLNYKYSYFHRIIPGSIVQGGDVSEKFGFERSELTDIPSGGMSIYGKLFEDETFEGKAGVHTGFGCLSMANSGPNTNGSQFFISIGETSWLDRKCVVFGKLTSGKEVLEKINSCGSPSGPPKVNVTISNCGQAL